MDAQFSNVSITKAATWGQTRGCLEEQRITPIDGDVSDDMASGGGDVAGRIGEAFCDMQTVLRASFISWSFISWDRLEANLFLNTEHCSAVDVSYNQRTSTEVK